MLPVCAVWWPSASHFGFTTRLQSGSGDDGDSGETIDPAPYDTREMSCAIAGGHRYDVRRPEGRSTFSSRPPIPDDIAFTRLLADEGVLAVRRGFGPLGYIRLSLTIPLEPDRKSDRRFQRAFLSSLRQESDIGCAGVDRYGWMPRFGVSGMREVVVGRCNIETLSCNAPTTTCRAS